MRSKSAGKLLSLFHVYLSSINASIFFYKNHYRSSRVPYTIYADFESILEECDESKGNNTKRYQNEQMKKKTKVIISKEEKNEYRRATNCFICDSEFDKDYKN